MVSSLVRELVTGKSTQKALDRNCCRKWVTNQAKAWARMHKVGGQQYTSKTFIYVNGFFSFCSVEFVPSSICFFATGIVNPIEAKVRKGKGAVGAYGNERTQQSLQDFPVVDSEEEEEKVPLSEAKLLVCIFAWKSAHFDPILIILSL